MTKASYREETRQSGWKAIWRPFVAVLAIELGSLSVGAASGSLTPDTWHLTPSLSAQQPPAQPQPTQPQPTQPQPQQPVPQQQPAPQPQQPVPAVPPRPPNVSDQQIQRAVERAATPEMIQQRIQQSGLSPAEIRARLQAAGYSPSLLDAYMGGAPAAQGAAAPAADVMNVVQSLGILEPAAPQQPQQQRPEGEEEPTAARRGAAAPGAGGLGIFGRNVFARNTTEFQAVTTGPVPPSYVVGPGDELVLILTGDVEHSYSLPISRDGFIVIPQVGQVWANGLTLERLRDEMYGTLGRAYSGIRRGPGATTFFELTLGRLRTNQVFITGEVAQPGTYLVSPVASVLNALYLAGGPTPNGSFRNVQIVRADSVVRRIDLYEYLLQGNNLSDVRLEPGDVVFVPVHGDQVAIHGQVNRPAIFELTRGDNLFDLLRYAGGVTTPAFFRRARIARVLPPAERVAPALDRVFIDVDLARALADSAAAPALRAGDDVAVFAIRDEVRNVVTIGGAVWREASYEYRRGMHLWDLVRLAEGLRVDAYLTRAHIVRMHPEDGTLSIIPVSLDTLPDGSPAENPELQEFDGVTVFARTAFEPGHGIEVRGSVRNPGAQPRFKGMTLRDAVLRAGGLDRDTYTGRAFISRRQADLTRRLIPITLTVDSLLIPLNVDTLEDFDIVEVLGLQQFANSFPVAISGEVREAISATYQEGMTLRDLVIRAGGLTPAADLTIEIARLAPQEQRVAGRLVNLIRVRVDSSFVVPDEAARFYLGNRDSLSSRLARSDEGTMPLQPYDAVFVRRLPGLEFPRIVVLAGEFKYPGRYSIERRDERLADIVRRAGGLTAAAYAPGAQFIRSEGGWGRVGIDLDNALKNPRSRDNVVLLAGDEVTVPEYQPTVKVEGAVNSPVTVAYVPRQSARYYVDHAGGFARQADKSRTYVVQPNGAVESRGATVQPGARVMVPAVPPGEEKTNWAQILSSVTSILMGALTIALVVQRL